MAGVGAAMDYPSAAHQPDAEIRRSIGDRWFALRNRLLASRQFQTWASRFPLTRPVARHRARDLFDLCAGFAYSQVLQACVQLRLFDALLDGPRTPEQVSSQLSLPSEPTACLLEAAAALDLAERRPDGRFGLGILGAALMGNPGVVEMIFHHRTVYADLADPVALLRGERNTDLARLWPYAGEARPADLRATEVDDYTTLMAASQPLVAQDILAAYRLDRHRCLLDLGGGDGTFLAAAGAAAPGLKLMLFDLPAVADRAHKQFADAGLTDRANVFSGDFRTDSLPKGADVISLIRVIHDHDNDTATSILSAAWSALPEGGTLLLAEPMAGTRNAERVGAYFALYLLAMGSGRPRRTEELSTLLHTAGFTDVRVLPTRRPMLVRVMVARK